MNIILFVSHLSYFVLHNVLWSMYVCIWTKSWHIPTLSGGQPVIFTGGGWSAKDRQRLPWSWTVIVGSRSGLH